ncbi:hypothetical protein DH2020_049520 [Rehmannia glutinosa]|uniref:Fatty acyl-CoA reductase n=1 Tax=Rehmannia glutinosa TaxID=99300 RepID=A0ABR0U3F9_REHGL
MAMSTPLSTRNALHLLEIAGRTDIPVAEGSHVTITVWKPIEQSAAEFLIEQASLYPGKITVVALGPLTNIALVSSSVSCNLFQDVIDEIKSAMKSCIASTCHDETKILKKLGKERAALYGYYNGYQLTKAMGEMVLNEIRGDIPLLIIRPSIIESSYKEPVPGWIQGYRMFDPVITSYGKGQLPAYLADPDVVADIVPVDMVANTIIAAIAKHGTVNTPQLNIYHVATSSVNPLRLSDSFEYMFHTGNTKKLLEEMSKEEQVEFNIDPTKIDWRKYFVEIHIPGLRKYVLNL